MRFSRRLVLYNKIILSSGYAPVGGQAVIEGVMMRSPSAIATAVRRADGQVVLERTPFRSVTKRNPILGLPVIRGVAGLIETMGLGMRSLNFSASEAAKDEDIKEGKSPDEAKGISKLSMGITMTVSFALGLLLFFYLPLKATEWLGVEGRISFNLVDGAIRLAVLLGYLYAMSRWREMARLFEFHGAEHKVIHTFEAGRPIVPEEAKTFSTLHPRCGTSFLFSAVILSIGIFIFFGRPDTLGERLFRLAGFPIIAGLGFEYIRFSGKHAGHWLVNAVAQPGLWLQKITTSEPDMDQLRVACESLNSVLPLSEEDLGDVRVM